MSERHVPDRSKLPAALVAVPWRPMKLDIDAMQIESGMQILAAVPVCNDAGNPAAGWHYELSVVDLYCDEHYMTLAVQDDMWEWELDDVDWYVILRR